MPTTATTKSPRRPRAAPKATRSTAMLLDAGHGAEPASNPKWIQVCQTGTFKGYRNRSTGALETFEITDATLDAMIANLHAHPNYVAGASELPSTEIPALVMTGKIGVVPFDIEHQPGPSEAWGIEMERRPNADGGSGLWLYTYFLEPAATWMAGAGFRWTSIEWTENATDPVSGKKVGPYVVRVALTNDPFVQGMAAIQNARDLGSRSFDPYCPPRSPTELLNAVRGLLGLPDVATLEAVLAAVSSLRAWATGELPPPVGVEVGELVGELRLLLNLPTLSDSASIFAELDKLLGAIAAETEEETPMPPTPAPAPAAPLEGTLLTAGTPEIVKHFASRLKTEVTEPAVTVELERRMGRGDDALALVDALMKALGAKTAQELTQKVTELVEIKARMDELIPEMEAQAEATEADAMGAVQQDVGAVMSMRDFPEALTDALTLQRQGGSADYFASLKPKEKQKARELARRDFLKRYEVDAIEVPAQFRHLTGPTLFAGRDAVFSPNAARGGAPARAPAVAPQFGQRRAPEHARGEQRGQAPAGGGVTWGDVFAHEGRNDAERCFSFVCAENPTLKYDAAWQRANDLRTDLINREGAPPAV